MRADTGAGCIVHLPKELLTDQTGYAYWRQCACSCLASGHFDLLAVGNEPTGIYHGNWARDTPPTRSGGLLPTYGEARGLPAAATCPVSGGLRRGRSLRLCSRLTILGFGRLDMAHFTVQMERQDVGGPHGVPVGTQTADWAVVVPPSRFVLVSAPRTGARGVRLILQHDL